MSTPPTDDERSQCLADTAVAVTKSGYHARTRIKVREHSAWTDPTTGEECPSHWVVEIRFGDPSTWHVVFEFEDWRIVRDSPGVWADLVAMECPKSPPHGT